MKHVRFLVMATLCLALVGMNTLVAQDVIRVAKGTKNKATVTVPEASPTPCPSPVATPAPVASPPAPTPVPQASPVPSAGPVHDADTINGLLSTVGTGIAEGEKREDPALVALGSMGAANLYYSYLTIGSIADGFVGGTYQPRIAISVANEAVFMNETSKASLVKLRDTGLLADEDREVIDFLVSTYDVLNLQAKALVTFISDRSNDGVEYQNHRKEAWKRIVSLFGMK